MNTALFSYFIIPLITFHLARGTDLFSTNFSTLRTVMERRFEFFLWCLITGSYFCLSICRLNSFYALKKKLLLPIAAAGLLLLSAFLPYRPDLFPLLSGLHLLSAFFSSLLLAHCLLALTLRLYFARPSKGRPLLLFFLISFTFCICSWIWTGIINTAMEICIVLTAGLMVRLLSRQSTLRVLSSE